MEFKKALKRIKKAMIIKERASRPMTIPDTLDEEEVVEDCLCTDKQNHFKTLYATRFEAERQAKFLYDEQGVFLVVYPCPHTLGWHLSKG